MDLSYLHQSNKRPLIYAGVMGATKNKSTTEPLSQDQLIHPHLIRIKKESSAPAKKAASLPVSSSENSSFEAAPSDFSNADPTLFEEKEETLLEQSHLSSTTKSQSDASSSLDDLVNLYLREVSKIRSLSREEATDVAKKLANYKTQLIHIFSHSFVIIKYLLDWIPQFENPDVDVGRYVSTIDYETNELQEEEKVRQQVLADLTKLKSCFAQWIFEQETFGETTFTTQQRPQSSFLQVSQCIRNFQFTSRHRNRVAG